MEEEPRIALAKDYSLSCSDTCCFWLIAFFSILMVAFAFLGRIEPLLLILEMTAMGGAVLVLAMKIIRNSPLRRIPGE